MHRIPRVLVLPFLVLFLSFGPVDVFAGSASVRLPYQLGGDAEFQEGCFWPCRCPIWAATAVDGSFDLVFSGVEGDMLVFDIPEILLQIRLWDGGSIPVTGSGRYRIRPGGNAVQSLELEVIREGETQTLHSGMVPMLARFPAIDVSIHENDLHCFDTLFRIQARPRGRGTALDLRDLHDDTPQSDALSMGMFKSRF